MGHHQSGFPWYYCKNKSFICWGFHLLISRIGVNGLAFSLVDILIIAILVAAIAIVQEDCEGHKRDASNGVYQAAKGSQTATMPPNQPLLSKPLR